MITSVEPLVALLQEQGKALFRDTIETLQMPFYLVPEVLDAIDVVPFVCKEFGVVDPEVLEFRHIQDVVTLSAI